MTDTPKRRSAPRPTVVSVPSITRKRFKRLTDVAKKVDLQSYDARTLPFVVAADLERGSLETLPGYIAKHQGIPDSDIAMNLLKLIIGSAEETPFRLVAIRHPDLKPNTKGSGPRGAVPSPRQKDHAIVAWYGELVADFGKGEAVITHMLTVTPGQCPRKKAIGKLSRSVIREALRRVRHEEATVRELQQRVKSTLARREASLAQIKDAEVVEPVTTAVSEGVLADV